MNLLFRALCSCLLIACSGCKEKGDSALSEGGGTGNTKGVDQGVSQSEKKDARLTPTPIQAAILQLTGAALPDPSQVSSEMLGGSVDLGIGEWELALSLAQSEKKVHCLLYGNKPKQGRSVLILAGDGSSWPDVMTHLLTKGVLVLVVTASTNIKISQHVQDTLTAIAYLRGRPDIQTIDFVGLGDAGPVSLLVRGLCGNAVRRTYAEYVGFTFRSVTDPKDFRYLPDALRYGDLGGLAVAAAPGELFLGSAKGLDTASLRKAYGESAALRIEEGLVYHSDIVQWLMR